MRERVAAANLLHYPSSQSWLPPFLSSFPTPALAGPRGMGAGETEMAGRGGRSGMGEEGQAESVRDGGIPPFSPTPG